MVSSIWGGPARVAAILLVAGVLPVAGASAAALESVEVLNLRQVDASGTDALIRMSAALPHMHISQAYDDDLKLISNELNGSLAASCLGEGSDPDPIYRYDPEGLRFDFGYFCDSISEKFIIKGYTEGRIAPDAVELDSRVVQISPRDPDVTLSHMIRLRLEGSRCTVEVFDETTELAGWPPEKANLITPETTCMVRFAQ